MALMMLVLAVFTVVSYGNVFTQGKYLCGMIVAVLVTSILLNVSYQYLTKKIICQNLRKRIRRWRSFSPDRTKQSGQWTIQRLPDMTSTKRALM